MHINEHAVEEMRSQIATQILSSSFSNRLTDLTIKLHVDFTMTVEGRTKYTSVISASGLA